MPVMSMPLRASALAAALAVVAAECDVCHLHYFHKDVSSAEVFSSNVLTCREYASESCCTAETAAGVGDAQKGYLYPDHTENDCGALTSACEQFFIEEGCFYECDKNLGKWRKHDDCSQDEANDNGWEVEGVPIRASYCDAWYEACRGPANKLCTGAASEPGAPVYSYFGQPDCHLAEGSRGCRQIDEVYTSGKHMCETMWGTAFKYEDDTSKDAYVMSFDEGDPNPNNAMFTSKAYPKRCSGAMGDVNFTKAADDGCPANWHTSADSYTEQHTDATLQCDDGDCTPQSESAACVSATAVGAGIAAAAAAALLA